MQPMFKPTEFDDRDYTFRPQPIEPVRHQKPWVVPLALTFLIVFLLIALVALGQQAPTSSDPLVEQTTVTTLTQLTP